MEGYYTGIRLVCQNALSFKKEKETKQERQNKLKKYLTNKK
jgi:hypothetical protein